MHFANSCIDLIGCSFILDLHVNLDIFLSLAIFLIGYIVNQYNWMFYPV